MTRAPSAVARTARRVALDDAAYVRAPIGLAYAVLTDVEAWPSWWPGVAVAPAGRVDRWRVRLGRTGVAEALAGAWRHDAGFRLTLGGDDGDGDLDGTLEWWLEPLTRGVVVHLVLDVAVGRGGRRAATDLRTLARRGLHGITDRLEAAVLLALADASTARP